MEYKVVVANGDKILTVDVKNVSHLDVINGVYVMYDATSTIIFTSPLDSVVYIKQTS